MAELLSVTAPLLVRYPSGERRVIAQRFPHPQGLLFFELFWHLREHSDGIHLLTGDIKGDGPWKIGDVVITVLGCHGTDPVEADQFARWQDYLQNKADGYPDLEQQMDIAEAHGAKFERPKL